MKYSELEKFAHAHFKGASVFRGKSYNWLGTHMSPIMWYDADLISCLYVLMILQNSWKREAYTSGCCEDIKLLDVAFDLNTKQNYWNNLKKSSTNTRMNGLFCIVGSRVNFHCFKEEEVGDFLGRQRKEIPNVVYSCNAFLICFVIICFICLQMKASY